MRSRFCQPAIVKRITTTRNTTAKDGVSRRLWVIGSGFLVLCFALVLALPSIVSSRWVYTRMLGNLEAGNFLLDIDTVSLRWFSPLTLKDIRIRERGKTESIVKIREVKTNQWLLDYLMNGLKVATIEIDSPQLDVDFVGDESNVRRLIDAIEGNFGNTRIANSKVRSPTALEILLIVNDLQFDIRKDGQLEPMLMLKDVDLRGSYRRGSDGSFIKIEPAELLRQTEITPELLKSGLEYAIPFLSKSTWLKGRVSLRTDAIEIPLENPIESRANAVITFHEVESGLSDQEWIQLVKIFARDLKSEEMRWVMIDNSQVEVRIRDGKVVHQGFVVGVPQIDTRLQIGTSGSVSLKTRELDMRVSVPVPLEQLALQDRVRELGVPTIALPIGGTIDHPKIDWMNLRSDSAELLGLIKGQIGDTAPIANAAIGALEGLAGGEADQALSATVDMLRELRRRRQEGRGENSESSTDPALESTDENRESRPFRDALRGIFGKSE